MKKFEIKITKIGFIYYYTFWQTTSLNYAVEVDNEKSDGVESKGFVYYVMVLIDFKSFQNYVRADNLQSEHNLMWLSAVNELANFISRVALRANRRGSSNQSLLMDWSSVQ